MALNFPNSPTLNQVYTDSTSGFSYQWNGTVWISFSAASSSQIKTLDDISASFNSSTTIFPLTSGSVSITPPSPQSLIINLGGVIQDATDDYSVSGSNIVFSTAPTSGLSFSGVSLGPAVPVNTIPDGTVTDGSLRISTTAVVGSATTFTEDLVVSGDARVTGILTVGTSSITLDGSNNQINVGTGVTVGSSGINVSGIITSTSIVVSAGTTSAPSISPSGDSNTGIFFPSADTIAASTGGTSRITIDSSGKILVGTSTAYATGGGTESPIVQLLGGSGVPHFLAVRITADAGPPHIVLGKTRGSAYEVVSNGDSIGLISFQAADGTNLIRGAEIRAQVDGAVGINSMPGRLVFSTTAAGGSSPTERMRITSAGLMGLGTSSPAQRLHLSHPTSGGTTSLLVSNPDGAAGATTGIKLGVTPEDNSVAKFAILHERFYSYGRGDTYFCSNFADDTTEVTDADAVITIKGSTKAVGINTTSPQAILSVSDGTVTGEINPYSASSTCFFGTRTNHSVSFQINASEKARIDTSGRLLIGTPTSLDTSYGTAGGNLQINNAPLPVILAAYTNDIYGGRLDFVKSRSTTVNGKTIVQNNDALGNVIWGGADGTNIIPAAVIGCEVDGTPGAGDMPGRIVLATTADGASTPTEQMRIGNQGTVFFGTTAEVPSTANVVGATFYRREGLLSITRDGGEALSVNRKTSDGNLVVFHQDGTVEGTITVSGTTVSYNGAHLSRWSQLPTGAEREEILRGSVLSNIDEMCEWGDEDNEQLNRMKVSDVEGDKNVSGVFQGWDDDDDTYTNDFYCAMTGDFIIRIAAGTTVERGDLLMSAGDGTAKPQDDDIIRSKTIAKVTSTNVSCTYADGSYCVPCVLMAC